MAKISSTDTNNNNAGGSPDGKTIEQLQAEYGAAKDNDRGFPQFLP